MLFVDCSSNKNASAVQPSNTLPQEIHLHHKIVHIHNNLLQIKSLSLESAQHSPEQLSLDAASKLFKCSHHLAISCDALSDPLLRQRATDFKQLVSIEILAVVLFQNALLTQEDMEHLQLPTMTESKKVDYVYLKMARLAEEDVKKFLNCLKDPYAMQHEGHIKLHDILSTSQQ